MKTLTALRSAPSRAGFTLIEILAVILIVGILATILITQLGGAEEAARVENTRRQLNMLAAALDNYENQHGNYPLSWFTEEQGVPNDGANVGVEAMVVALWSDGWDAGGLLPDFENRLENIDGDSSAKTLTDFQTRELLEVVDDWLNPVAYIHRQEYEITNRSYVTLDPLTGEELTSFPKAFKNDKTGRFFNHTKYQLISAGPDGEFGTEDDITPFDRF